MNQRIKQLRRSLNLTQQDFAERIGLKQNSIALIESGKRNISNQAVLSICREFNVNETWLRTGDGEMFNEMDREEQIAYYLGDIFSEPGDTFKKRLVAALAAMDESEWAAVEAFARKLVEQSRDSPPNKESGTKPQILRHCKWHLCRAGTCPRRCRHYRLRTSFPSLSLRGAQRRGCAAVREERALRMRRTPCGCNLLQALQKNKKGWCFRTSQKEKRLFFPNDRAYKLQNQPKRALVREF